MAEIYKVKYNDVDYIMIPIDLYIAIRESYKEMVEQNKKYCNECNEIKLSLNEMENEIKNYNGECDYCIMNREEA